MGEYVKLKMKTCNCGEQKAIQRKLGNYLLLEVDVPERNIKCICLFIFI